MWFYLGPKAEVRTVGPSGLGSDDLRLHTYLNLVAPRLTEQVRRYRHKFFLEVVDGDTGVPQWIHPKGLTDAEVYSLPEVHLAAALECDPLPFREYWVRGVGVCLPRDTPVQLLSIDLDGGYPAQEFIAALERRIGPRRILITAGSGREGRYRLWLMAATPLPVQDVRPTVGRLLREIGYPMKPGSAEVFPDASHNGRLPFGIDACRRFSSQLNPGRPQSPLELLAALERLRPVNLTGYSASAIKKRRVRRPDSRRRKALGSLPYEVRQLWNRGVAGEGQRDMALRELTWALHRKGHSRRETKQMLRSWVRKGGLSRSRVAKNPKAFERTLRADIPRVVDHYYDDYKQALPAPEHLTRRDTRCVIDQSKAVAELTGIAESAVATFLLRLLPFFRAAEHAGFRPPDANPGDTRPTIRLHRDTWLWAAAGTGYGYIELRDACGLFEDAGLPYRPEKLCPNPGDARCKTWICTFKFQHIPSPARPVIEDFRRLRLGWSAHWRAMHAPDTLNHSEKSQISNARRRRRPARMARRGQPDQLDLGFEPRYRRRDPKRIAERTAELMFLLDQALRGPPQGDPPQHHETQMGLFGE